MKKILIFMKTVILVAVFIVLTNQSILAADNKISEYRISDGIVSLYITGINNLSESYEYQIGNVSCEIDNALLLPSSNQQLHTIVLWDNSLSATGKNENTVRSLLTDIIANRVEGEVFSIAEIDDQANFSIEDSNDYAVIKEYIDNTPVENKDAYLIENIFDIIEYINQSESDGFYRIIALSDGADATMSGVSLDELNKLIQKYPCPIYTVNVSGTTPENVKNMASISRTSNADYFSLVGNEAVKNDVIINKLRSDANILKVEVEIPLEMRDGSTKNTRLTVDGNNYDCELSMPFDISESPDEVAATEEQTKANDTEENKEEEYTKIEVPEQKNKGISMNILIIAAAVIFIIIVVIIVILVINSKKSKKKIAERKKAEEMGKLGQGISNPYSKQNSSESTVLMDDNQEDNHTVLLFDNNDNSSEGITLRNVKSPADVYSASLNGIITVGRGSANTIVISGDGAVSEKHCEIYMNDGVVYVRDVGSSNGTKVGGARISSPTRLNNGDMLTLGFSQFEVNLD